MTVGMTAEYDAQGYVIVPNALDAASIEATRAEVTAICRGGRGAIDGAEPTDMVDDLAVLR
jgi:hypothetical protein